MMVIQSLLLALVWFTRIPIHWKIPNAVTLQQQSLAWLPLIGALVGSVTVMVCRLTTAWPVEVSALLALTLLLLLTGALHEDGWADGWDALGAGGDAERRLAVLKDPRLGTFGVAALVVTLALQFLALRWLGRGEGAWLLVGVHVASRLPLPLLAWLLPYVRKAGEGKAEFLRQPVAGWAWGIWGAWVLPLSWVCWMQGLHFTLGVLVSALACLLAVLPWQRALGGVTGDVFGFCQQAGLLAGLLVALYSGGTP